MDTIRVPLNNIESAQLTEPAPPPLEHVSQGSVPVIVGAFWGVLGLVIIVISCVILYHISKRRHRALAEHIHRQRSQAEEQRQRTDVEEGSVPQKPVAIPIVVVLPNDEVAFGWKLPSSREDSLESINSLDSIKLEKESDDDSCDALKNDTDITRSGSSSSSSSSPV